MSETKQPKQNIRLPYTLKEGTNVGVLSTQKRKVLIHDDMDAPISKIYSLKTLDYSEVQSMIRDVFNLMLCRDIAPALLNIDISPDLDVFVNLEHYDCDFASFITSWKCTKQSIVNSIILQLGDILNKLIELNVSHRTINPNDLVCKVFVNNGALEHVKISLIDFENSVNRGVVYSSVVKKANNKHAIDKGFIDLSKDTSTKGYDDYSIRKVIEEYVLSLPDNIRQACVNPNIVQNPKYSVNDKMMVADFASFCLDPSTPYEDRVALNVIVSTLKWQNVEPFDLNKKIVHAIVKYLSMTVSQSI